MLQAWSRLHASEAFRKVLIGFVPPQPDRGGSLAAVAAATPDARLRTDQARSAATAAGARKIVLNFRRSDYINSAGIAILIRIVTEVNRAGQKLAMSGLNEHFQKIFRMVGLSQYATIFDDEVQAVAALAAVEGEQRAV